MQATEITATVRPPWNKGKIVGQKTPFKLKEIWAIRIRLQLAVRRRELALFNLIIDSKLRACDLVSLRVRDVCHGQTIAARTIVMQQKTQRPVQFEITEPTREAVGAWIGHARLTSEDSLFPSRVRSSAHLSTRQYARIVDSWGETDRTGQGPIRDAHAEADEGDLDLPPDEEPARGPTSARAYQTRKHGPLPRHRGE